jgi:multiple sugar transport system ATP-binding protein
VVLKDVEKTYPGGVTAVSKFTLDVADREFVVFVGPSGCGKSTTLRCVAGLEDITAGTIHIGERLVNDVPPKDRDIAMVFQNYALYPHMTVFENMAFALKLRKLPRDVIAQKVDKAAKILGIDKMLDRKPKTLSGGQRQRVALGRAIVRDPKCFLFDEPLSNLDAKLRGEMRAEIKRLHMDLKSTTIYVTHDQEEAMTLGDRVVVMKDGVIQQCGAPLDVYHHPENRFVAGFVVTPPMNFLEGTIAEDNGKLCSRGRAGSRCPIEQEALANRASKIVLGVRPRAATGPSGRRRKGQRPGDASPRGRTPRRQDGCLPFDRAPPSCDRARRRAPRARRAPDDPSPPGSRSRALFRDGRPREEPAPSERCLRPR